MIRAIGRMVPLCFAFSLGVAAQVADFSGTWQLNVERSRWGKARKPSSAALTIEHRDPALKYYGMIVDDSGDVGRPFSFEGAIDGKEYPSSRSYGQGKITFAWQGRTTVVSDFKSDDGLFTETARNTLSGDGKTLTRRIRVKGPNTDLSWTEIYEKK